MSRPPITPGRWAVSTITPLCIVAHDPADEEMVVNVALALSGNILPSTDETARANAGLIVLAPDHAEIGWAMCVAAGRWEPWGDGRGEFCMNGLRFATKLDPFGIPEVTPPLREQIARARGDVAAEVAS